VRNSLNATFSQSQKLHYVRIRCNKFAVIFKKSNLLESFRTYGYMYICIAKVKLSELIANKFPCRTIIRTLTRALVCAAVQCMMFYSRYHGLRTTGKEIAFTTRPKVNSHSQIFKYGRSIFCLPHQPKFSDFFDLCFHWVSVVRGRYAHRKVASLAVNWSTIQFWKLLAKGHST
jgi:hypothetical protein